jgi:DNA-binding Lrp family transcriptional regulator
MNDIQKEIMNYLQEGIPLKERPYEDISKKIGISEEEIVNQIRIMKEEGFIRRFGAISDINKIGISSTLVGLMVEEDQMESVARKVGEFEGVTHNYERKDDFNLWFTLMEKDSEEIERKLDLISKFQGVKECINLPAVKKYKTKVIFKL